MDKVSDWTGFHPIERALFAQRTVHGLTALADGLVANEYVRRTGSGLFAVPPGVRQVGDWFGKALFTG